MAGAETKTGIGRVNSVLLVGTFISSSKHNHSVGEDLGLRLRRSGWNVITTSDKVGRAARVVDMMSTVLHQRRNYQVAQVDVYSGLAFVWAEMVCTALRMLGKPIILSLHGGRLPEFASRFRWRTERLLRTAEEVTVPSQYLLSEMDPFCKRLSLLPNGLDTERFSFRLRRITRPRLVWLRAFDKAYNPGMALDVIERLRSAYPDIRLTMIGPDKGGGTLADMRRRAEERGLADVVTFTGGISNEDVPKYLQESDIFLNTTNVDNTPVSVLEAMACGLCVVSTDAGGLGYLIRDEHDGLLVAKNDAEAMSAAVDRIIHDSALAERLSAQARIKAQDHSWEAILPIWHSKLTRAGRAQSAN